MRRLYKDRIITLTLAVLLLLLAHPSWAADVPEEVTAQNLVENGDFEDIGDGWPAGFGSFRASGNPVFSVDEEAFYSGSKSVSISGNGTARGSVDGRAFVEGGKSYRFTVWYKAAGNITRSDVVVRLMAFKTMTGHSEDYKAPWQMEWVHDLSESSYRVGGNNFEIRPIEISDDWQALTVAFTLPEDVVRLEIDLFNWLGNGTVWYDALSLVELPDPPQLEEPTAMDDTSAKLFEALDLTWPGLEAVAAAVEEGDLDAARVAFADYLRTREHPQWYFDWRNPLDGRTVDASDVTAATNALRQRFTVIDLPYTFTGEIDWAYNPTMEPGSSYAPNHEWTWQFNRHRFWLSMGRTYQLLKDETYTKTFAEQMTHWVENNPVPIWADQQPYSRWRTIEAGIRMQNWTSTFLYFFVLAQLNEYELPDGYLDQLERMFDFNLYMMTPLSTLPPFNDSGAGDPTGYLWQGYEHFPHRQDFLWGGNYRTGGAPPEHTSYAFTYDSSQWRTYVLGPYAHNVAFVDGLGQNRRIRRETFVTNQPSDFIWELTPEYEFAQGYYGSESEGFGPQRRVDRHPPAL